MDTIKELKCENCEKKKSNVIKRKIKENGVLGYYDVEVMWCDECVGRQNKYLLENWG